MSEEFDDSTVEVILENGTPDTIEIAIAKINKCITEKKLGGKTTIYGVCRATNKETGTTVSFDFAYIGELEESCEKIYDFLKTQALVKLVEKEIEDSKPPTLGKFLDDILKYSRRDS